MGVIHTTDKNTEPQQKSSFHLLPIVNLNPNDLNSLNTCLYFLSDHAFKAGVDAVITFDQPLWWKANMLCQSESPDSPLRNILLMLGVFHLILSLLAATTHFMIMSGLDKALEHIYAANTVPQIISGKSYNRAIRAHTLVLGALGNIRINKALGIEERQINNIQEDNEDGHEEDDGEESMENNVKKTNTLHNETDLTDLTEQSNEHLNVIMEDIPEISLARSGDDIMEKLKVLYKSLTSGEVSINEAAKKPVITHVVEALINQEKTFKGNRTAALWLQYEQMVRLILRLLKSERNANYEH